MQEPNQKSNKFLYQGAKHKKNVWENIEESNSVQSASHQSNVGAFNSLGNLNFSGNAFDFDNAWSIRKNVPLPSSNKPVSVPKNFTSTSYYSRHVNIKGGTDVNEQHETENSRFGANGVSENVSGSRGWNMKRPEYSYATTSTSKHQNSENEKDHSGSAAKKRNFQYGEGFVGASKGFNKQCNLPVRVPNDVGDTPNRKMSARTQKAKNIYNAYLKSSGLGQYTPKGPDYLQGDDDSSTRNGSSDHRQISTGSDRSF